VYVKLSHATPSFQVIYTCSDDCVVVLLTAEFWPDDIRGMKLPLQSNWTNMVIYSGKETSSTWRPVELSGLPHWIDAGDTVSS
jgi:hypothetical protein